MGLDWFSQKLWQLSSFLFGEKQEPVLSELGWAGLQAAVSHNHTAVRAGCQDMVAPVTSQTVQEFLYRSGQTACAVGA